MSVVELRAGYRVVTPLFCGGARPTEQGELRLPSFKGVLRYWWRALAWSEYEADLQDIRAAEDELFGSGGASARRSRVVLRLKNVSNCTNRQKEELLRKADNRVVGQGARYLGYGLMEAFDRASRGNEKSKKAGELLRPCLAPRLDTDFQFTVHLRCRDVRPSALALLRRALKVMGTVGGLGARSRRGYGSVMLTDLSQNDEPCWDAPTSIADLQQQIDELTKATRHPGLPQYTAFSQNSRHVLLEASTAWDPLVLLDRVGREMIRFRSFGRKHMILGGQAESERQFKDDHDLVESVAKGSVSPLNSHPHRVAFGLPHNYFFSSIGKPVAVGPGGRLDRRASPLFIHIHMCGTSPVAVLSFLPAVFLPDGATIDVGRHEVPLASQPALYKPISDFLDRFTQRDHKEPFTRVEVCP